MARSLLSVLLVLSAAVPAAAQVSFSTVEGDQAGAHAGTAVAIDGDVDGDGVADLVLGEPDQDIVVLGIPLAGAGRVRVFSGATGQLLWQRVGSQSGERYGFDVALLGDLDLDGLDDVLVGRPGARLQAGPLSVAVGGVAVLSGVNGAIIHDDVPLDITLREYGRAVSALPDVTGDFVPDYAVGSPRADVAGQVDAGEVLLFSGRDHSEVHRFTGFVAGAGFGWSLDGRDPQGGGGGRLVVGSPFHPSQSGLPDDGGRVDILAWLGGGVPVSLAVFVSATAGARMGWSVGLLGDLDADGHHEVAYGAPGVGEVTVASDLSTWLPLEIPGLVPGDGFGAAVEGLGDLDGDGLVELAVGAPDHDGGRGYAARLRVADGVLLTLHEGSPGSGQGAALAGGGDLDGDGRPDLAVGAPLATGSAGSEAGLVTAYGSGCHAHAYNYLTGLAGTLGVPTLALDAAPVLGTSLTLSLGNSAGVPTQGLWLVGFAYAALPFKGGHLWLQPQLQFLVQLPVGGLDLAAVLPGDPGLCGVGVYQQLAVADPGAPVGVALSPGLYMLLGEP